MSAIPGLSPIRGEVDTLPFVAALNRSLRSSSFLACTINARSLASLELYVNQLRVSITLAETYSEEYRYKASGKVAIMPNFKKRSSLVCIDMLENILYPLGLDQTVNSTVDGSGYGLFVIEGFCEGSIWFL